MELVIDIIIFLTMIIIGIIIFSVLYCIKIVDKMCKKQDKIDDLCRNVDRNTINSHENLYMLVDKHIKDQYQEVKIIAPMDQAIFNYKLTIKEISNDDGIYDINVIFESIYKNYGAKYKKGEVHVVVGENIRLIDIIKNA